MAQAYVEVDVDGVVENAAAAHGPRSFALQLEDGEEERKALQITDKRIGS